MGVVQRKMCESVTRLNKKNVFWWVKLGKKQKQTRNGCNVSFGNRGVKKRIFPYRDGTFFFFFWRDKWGGVGP